MIFFFIKCMFLVIFNNYKKFFFIEVDAYEVNCLVMRYVIIEYVKCGCWVLEKIYGFLVLIIIN